MRKALVIEDNVEIRENIVEVLELAGFRVFVANDGNEGLQVAADMGPDVILCDIMMPGLNGYEVIRELRANSATSKIPFIYVTASTEKSEVIRAMRLGADGYVRKPFEVSELMDTIESLLKKKASGG